MIFLLKDVFFFVGNEVGFLVASFCFSIAGAVL